ncbi:DegT/DnrJ/EryC1/StrS family aminotransferase [Actinopolymorpha singaporensis]|uniref:dTDP-4-amino-4,6-dideoxygalactose transaminase n=1 Tax=Actinopolymorpha singaporensis TaxID=117157 RepID=A0A1H1WJ55_9ACTN|nr:DegT/DnrJ/EryC1/StrS aminotransferase family protein [Actinopolymorpha singaporensis]SDS97135.1 dTDP-4-amino-4,6-dideoxygalactose transaminase [Actinopolymorpha singaporensis]
MADHTLPFALPDIGEEEIQAVSDALRSGWLSSGPRVEEFERRFAALCGDGAQAVALNSATAGLHLALEAAGIGPGAEVLVPTWTFTATAEIVVHLGARPVFVDSDPVTLNIDLADAERKVTERTRAVLPVHFAGRAVSPSRLHEFAVRHHLHVVEDAAHAFPSASEGVPVGAGHSTATVFSFYATKTITTGEGGMLVTRDLDLAKHVRMTRLHGIDRNAFDRYRSDRPAWRYNIAAAGYKYNLTDTAAAMGLVQLDRAEKMHLRREQIAERYRTAFTDLPLDLPEEAPAGDIHSWHLFVVRLWDDAELGRNEFIAEMSRRGVCCSVHFIPLHMHSYWREQYDLRDEMFPVASSVFERVVSIPLYSGMTDEDVDRVIETVRDVLR